MADQATPDRSLPLGQRLKEEEPDVTEHQVDPYSVGRLVAPDQGFGEDTEAQAVAEEYAADGAGLSAEEAAIHVMAHEPPLEDSPPDYTSPA